MAQSSRSFALPLDDPEKLVSTLNGRYTRAVASRPDQQAKVNLAFLLGHHWAAWDPYSKRLRQAYADTVSPTAPIRVTVNKIASHVEWAIARLTRSAPSPECRPVSDEDDDISTARVGTRILGSEFSRLEFDERLTHTYAWVVPVGYAYLQITWDSKAGPKVGDHESTVEIPAERRSRLGRPPSPTVITTSKEVFRGDVCHEVVPHFELAVDPAARSMDEARWAIRAIALPREEIYERWGKDPEGGEQAITVATELRNLAQIAPGRREEMTGELLVKEFWLKPGSRSHPEGLRLTWCGKTILSDPERFPYDHGRLPFVQFDLLPGMGRREGRTWVDDLVQINTDYNDARSRLAETRRTFTPKVFYIRNSLNPRKITSRIEWIDVANVGHMPTAWMPDSSWMIPLEKSMDRVDKEMSERSSLAPSTRGELLSGVSAAALLASQEAADIPGNISLKARDRAVAETGWQTLMLTRQYWNEERTVRTWSEDGSKLDVDRYTKADIKGQLDVHVTSESSLPKSKAARVQIAMELSDRKLIEDPMALLRYMDLPGTDFLVRQLDLSQRQALRENDKLIKGEEVEVAKWHNHIRHVATHNELRMTEEYETAPDHIRAVIDAHVDLHDGMMVGQIQAPGPPGAPGSIPLSGPGELPPGGNAPGPGNVQQGIADLLRLNTPGQPGRVPNVSPDEQAASMGS